MLLMILVTMLCPREDEEEGWMSLTTHGQDMNSQIWRAISVEEAGYFRARFNLDNVVSPSCLTFPP